MKIPDDQAGVDILHGGIEEVGGNPQEMGVREEGRLLKAVDPGLRLNILKPAYEAYDMMPAFP